MKKKLIQIFILLAILMVFFTGCPMPSNYLNDEPQAVPGGEPGNLPFTGVKLTLPRYAPWLGQAVAASGQSRAFAFNDKVHIIVKSSDNTEVFNNTFSPELDGSQEISCNVVIPSGTGYTAEVEIFNNVVSTTDPVVTGTSEAFDITEGNSTNVSVFCLPVSPQTVAADTPHDLNMVPMLLAEGPGPMTTGSEQWFSAVMPDSGYMEISFTVPDDITAYFSVFDPNGALVSRWAPGRLPGSYTTEIGGPAGETCYLVVVFAHSSSTDQVSGSVSYTELTPKYLTDEDVPDPELRTLMESYTGKEFTITGSPAPANPISDMDLAALDRLFCDGVSGITNLTGLSYCKNIDFLLLNGNNLSGDNVHWEELASLTNLTGVDVCGCDLQNLDFVEHLNNPGFRQIVVYNNPDIGLSDILKINSTRFPKLFDFGFTDYDTSGDGVADPIPTSDWSAIVDELALFEHLGELRIGRLSLTDDMFNELLTEVINLRKINWEWLDLSYSQISDLSNLVGLPNLSCLNMAGTDITDLVPLKLLYDNDGAFHDSESWVDIRNCNLDLLPGSPNRAVVDYLIDHGVRVIYEEGNTLVAPPGHEADFVFTEDHRVFIYFDTEMAEDPLNNPDNFTVSINSGPSVNPTHSEVILGSEDTVLGVKLYLDNIIDEGLSLDDTINIEISENVVTADSQTLPPEERSLSFTFEVDLSKVGFDETDISYDSPAAGNVSIGALDIDPSLIYNTGFAPADDDEVFISAVTRVSFGLVDVGKTHTHPNSSGDLSQTWDMPLGTVYSLSDSSAPIVVNPEQFYAYILNYNDVDVNGHVVSYQAEFVVIRPTLPLDDVRVDVTLNMDYTGSIDIGEDVNEHPIYVYLTYSDTMAPFAWGEVNSRNGSFDFDDYLIPRGTEVKAIAWIDTDDSDTLTGDDRYIEYTTPISVNGGSATLNFDDTNLYTRDEIDITNWRGFYIDDDIYEEMNLYITGDAVSILRINPSDYGDGLYINNYGTIVSHVNLDTASGIDTGHLIFQMDYHPHQPFIGKYAKITWTDNNGITLDKIYYYYDTAAEAEAATEGGHSFK